MKKLTIALLLLATLPCPGWPASLPNQPEVRLVIIDRDPPPRVVNWSTLVRYLRSLKLRRQP